MKTIAPNIAIPIVKPIAFATLNTLERKSFSGMIGSGARRSRQTNTASSATPATASPTIVVEPQAYWLPPQVVSRISEATPPVEQRGAEEVDPVAHRRRVQVQPRATITTASAPTGMFT